MSKVIGYYVVEICKLEGVQRAVEELNVLYKDVPKGAEYYNSMAQIYGTIYDYTTAIEYITKAIELSPDDKFYYSYRATFYEKVGNSEMSSRDRQKFEQLMKQEYKVKA